MWVGEKATDANGTQILTSTGEILMRVSQILTCCLTLQVVSLLL